MEKVQKILLEKYKLEQPVGISISRSEGETQLTVTIENSRLSDSSDSYKKALADSIGKICVANFRSVKFSDGELVFSEHHNYIVASTTTENSYDMHISGTPPKTAAE